MLHLFYKRTFEILRKKKTFTNELNLHSAKRNDISIKFLFEVVISFISSILNSQIANTFSISMSGKSGNLQPNNKISGSSSATNFSINEILVQIIHNRQQYVRFYLSWTVEVIKLLSRYRFQRFIMHRK